MEHGVHMFEQSTIQGFGNAIVFGGVMSSESMLSTL